MVAQKERHERKSETGDTMLQLFKKDPSKKLLKAYEGKLAEAMVAQRNGDIRSYSMLSKEADEIYQKLQELIKEESIQS